MGARAYVSTDFGGQPDGEEYGYLYALDLGTGRDPDGDTDGNDDSTGDDDSGDDTGDEGATSG